MATLNAFHNKNATKVTEEDVEQLRKQMKYANERADYEQNKSTYKAPKLNSLPVLDEKYRMSQNRTSTPSNVATLKVEQKPKPQTMNVGGKTYKNGQTAIINGQKVTIDTNIQNAEKLTRKNKSATPVDNQKFIAQHTSKGAKFGSEHPILGTLGSFAEAPLVGMEGAARTLGTLATGDESFITSPRGFITSQNDIREGAESNFGNFGDAVYDIGTGVGDMLIDSAIGSLTGGSAVAGALMGGQKAGNATKESFDRNDDARRAALYGTLAGATEGFFNTKGLDSIKNGLKGSGAKKVLKAAGIEGAENALQNVTENIADVAVNGKNSEILSSYNNYINSGMDKKTAAKKVTLDTLASLGADFGMGSVFGGALGGIKLGLDNVKADVPTIKADEDIDIDTRIANRLKAEQEGRIPTLDTKNVPTVEQPITSIPNEVESRVEPKNNVTDRLIKNDESNNVFDDDDIAIKNIVDNLNSSREGMHFVNDADRVAHSNATDKALDTISKMQNAQTEDELVQYATELERSIREMNTLRQNATVTISEDVNADLRQAIKDQTKGTTIRLTDDLRNEMGLKDMKVPVINRQIQNALGVGKDNLKVSTTSGYPIDEVITPELRTLIGVDESATNADTLNALLSTINGTKGVTTSEVGAGDIPALSDNEWEDIANYMSRRADSFDDYAIAEDIGLNPNTYIDEDIEPIRMTVALDGEAPSQAITNTARRMDLYRGLDEDTIDNMRTHKIAHEIDTLDEAMSATDTQAKIDSVVSEFLDGKAEIDSNVNVDKSMLALNNLKGQYEDALASGDIEAANAINVKRSMLLKKLGEAGTKYGQTIQAFAKWTRYTPEGAEVAGNKLLTDRVNAWSTNHVKQVKENGKLAHALEIIGNKDALNKTAKAPKTREQVRAEVVNTLNREMGSVDNLFDDNAIDALTEFAMANNVSYIQLADEVEHYLNNGTFYTIDESTPVPTPTNTKLANAFKNMLDDGSMVKEKEPKSLNQIREEVANTVYGEYASVADNFSEADIDYLANLINNGATGTELTDALNTKIATGTFGLSDDTMSTVNSIFEEISHYDVNSREFVDGESTAYALIANEVMDGAPWYEKFNAWRYLAMLGNPKTMIRNAIGNKIFGAVTGVSNNVAAAIETAVDGITGGKINRTKAILNPISDRNLIKSAENDAYAKRYRQLAGDKYHESTKGDIERNRDVWDSKVMRGVENLVDKGISDTKAVVKKYSTSLAGYMKANGLDESAFDAESRLSNLRAEERVRLLSNAERTEMNELKDTIDALNKARDYAQKQAEYATFHEDNAVASAITKFSNTNAGTKIVTEGILPFKKTPANVLKSGVQYSPFGAIDSVAKTGKLILDRNKADVYTNKRGVEKNAVRAADVIDSWSKTLTGTGLAVLGMYLFDKDILKVSNSEEKYQDQLEGIQNYSIKFTNPVNNKEYTYTIDWAAPAVMPLLLGAEVSKVMDNSGMDKASFFENLDKIGLDDIMQSSADLISPIMETSMLSGVNDTLEAAADTIKNEKSPGGVLGVGAWNAITGYATQAIPTVAGQIARTIDNTRRSTYSDKDSEVARAVDKQVQKLENKIPGLTYTNNPYVDTWGREQQNAPSDNMLFNAAYQFLSPGYADDINVTDADRVVRDAEKLPDLKTSYSVDGKRLSSDDYYKFAKERGQSMYDMVTDIGNKQFFDNMSTEDKQEALSSIYGLATKIGEREVNPNVKLSDQNEKMLKAYDGSGAHGVTNYLFEKNQKSILTDKLESVGVKYSDKNKELYDTYGDSIVNVLGDIQKYGTSKGKSVTANSMLPVLEKSGMSQYDNSYILATKVGYDNLTKTAKQLADKNDYNSLYEYYRLKNMFDGSATGKTDGKLTGKEVPQLESWLRQSGYSQGDINAIMSWYN